MQDIIGKKFGLLTVIKFISKRKHTSKKTGNKYRRFVYRYLCKCDCGKIVTAVRSNLITEHKTSCGCKKRRKMENNCCWKGHGKISGRVWSHIKNHARKRKLEFSISIEEAWERLKKQNFKCALSGINISVESYKGDYFRRTASLDRIDNTKGYTKENIQWLHKDVNWMKGKFSQKKFVQICKSVAKNN